MASGWANDGAVQDQIDSTIEDAVPLSHTGSTHDTDMRHDLAVITDFYILIDVCKRMDGYVRS
mgnify:CR=1 FL=1